MYKYQLPWKCRTKLIILNLMILLLIFNSAAIAKTENDIAADWLQLWTRCRISTENAQPLDVNGLIDGGFSIKYTKGSVLTIPKNSRNPEFNEIIRINLIGDFTYFQREWHKIGSRFFIVIRENPSMDGRLAHSCNLMLNDENIPITPDEEEILTSAFLAERERLIAAGKHEVRDPDSIFSTALGVGPKQLNINGCQIISGLYIETREGYGPFFQSMNAEQAKIDPRRVCGTTLIQRLIRSLDDYRIRLKFGLYQYFRQGSRF